MCYFLLNGRHKNVMFSNRVVSNHSIGPESYKTFTLLLCSCSMFQVSEIHAKAQSVYLIGKL